jgi:hypothetical protein
MSSIRLNWNGANVGVIRDSKDQKVGVIVFTPSANENHYCVNIANDAPCFSSRTEVEAFIAGINQGWKLSGL